MGRKFSAFASAIRLQLDILPTAKAGGFLNAMLRTAHKTVPVSRAAALADFDRLRSLAASTGHHGQPGRENVASRVHVPVVRHAARRVASSRARSQNRTKSSNVSGVNCIRGYFGALYTSLSKETRREMGRYFTVPPNRRVCGGVDWAEAHPLGGLDKSQTITQSQGGMGAVDRTTINISYVECASALAKS